MLVPVPGHGRVAVSNLLLARKLKREGIVYPLWTIKAAHESGISLALACSILIQETSGGLNEWGHDPTIFVGGYDAFSGKHWGELVTEDAYRSYKYQRQRTGRCQGVGPCQLTNPAFQDAADRIGGCWKPYPNMLIGFTDLANTIRRDGLVPAVTAYNGSGPQAEAYAHTVIERANAIASKLGLPKP